MESLDTQGIQAWLNINDRAHVGYIQKIGTKKVQLKSSDAAWSASLPHYKRSVHVGYIQKTGTKKVLHEKLRCCMICKSGST